MPRQLSLVFPLDTLDLPDEHAAVPEVSPLLHVFQCRLGVRFLMERVHAEMFQPILRSHRIASSKVSVFSRRTVRPDSHRIQGTAFCCMPRPRLHHLHEIREGRDNMVGGNHDHYHLPKPVSYTHLRAHETKANLVCRLLLEKKKK